MEPPRVLLIGTEPTRMTRLRRTFSSLERMGYDVRILNPYQSPAGSPRILKGVIRYLLVLLQVLGADADVFHFFNVPDVVGIPLVLKKGKFIYDVRSPWFSSVKETIGFDILSRIAEFMEKLLTKSADFVLTANTPLAERAKRWGAKNVEVVPNYPPTSFQNDISRAKMRKRLDIEDSPTILYLGKISKLEGSELLKDIMKKVLRENTDTVFMIVGDGPRKESLKDFVDRHGYGNRVRMIGWVPHEEVPNYIAAADICLLPREWTSFSPFTSPDNILKVGEYLALGKPVVVPRMGGFADAEFPIISVDLENMASAILEFIQEPRDVPLSSRPSWEISHQILGRVYQIVVDSA